MSNQESDSARIQRQANELSQHEYNQRIQKSSGCFPAGTRIETPMGAIPIEDLSAGDRVIGCSTNSKIKNARRILKVVRHSETAIWRITLDKSRFIFTTSVHSFYSKKKWRVAKSLKKGDTILVLSDEGIFREEIILNSELMTQSLPVYNLITEQDFTFIAEGALVHSFSYFRTLRKLFWTIRAVASELGGLSKFAGLLSFAQQNRN